MSPMACGRCGRASRRARSPAGRRGAGDGAPGGLRRARKIHELSGGQQQRVALARALVNRPAVLLLDEPLAALDKKLRTDMQIELQNLQRELGITFVLVTHDQEEALSMSDIVCVMNGGRIVQLGQPDEIYDEPADLFVADFVGKTNLLTGTVAERSTASAPTSRWPTASVVAARDAAGARQRASRLGQHAAGGAQPRQRGQAAFARAPSQPHLSRLDGRICDRGRRASARCWPRPTTMPAKARSMKPGEPVAMGFAPGAPQAFPDANKNGIKQRETDMSNKSYRDGLPISPRRSSTS